MSDGATLTRNGNDPGSPARTGMAGRVATAIAVVLLAAIAVAGAWWVQRDHTWVGQFSDAAEYLLLADYYRGALSGQWLNVATEYYRVSRFPPVYPLLLALVGGGTEAVQAAAQATQALVLLALLAAAAYMARALGSLRAALPLVALLVLSPGPLLLQIDPVSEPLMALMLYSVLLLAGTRRHWIAIAALIGASLLVRTAMVAAIPALFIASWMQAPPGRRRGPFLLTAMALAPALAWFLYRQSQPGVDSYAIQYQIAGDFVRDAGGWTRVAWTQLGRLVAALASNFDIGVGALAQVGSALLLGFACIGGWLRARAGELDAWFAACYLALILVWPYPLEMSRLLLPLLPLLLVLAHVGLVQLLSLRAPRFVARPGAAPFASLLLVALPLASAVPSDLLLLRRMSTEVEPDLRPYQRGRDYLTAEVDDWSLALLEVNARNMAAIQALHQYVPPGECVYIHAWQRARAVAGILAAAMPASIDPGKPVRAQFPICRYALASLQSTWQVNGPSLFPIQYVQDFARPLFVSEFEYRGSRRTAAALLDLGPHPGAEPAPAPSR